jgi:hypothetical protein
MVTVQQVFDTAISLINEQAQRTGLTIHADTVDYANRCIPILNTLLPHLYLYSDEREVPKSGRPECPVLFAAPGGGEPDFLQDIPLDNTLCLGVLPYGLAAHLVANEDGELSRWLLSRYNSVFADIRANIPASFEPISTPYGLF